MKLLGSILALAILVAALRVAFAVLAMVLVAMFLWGLVTNPSRTFAFIGVMLLFNVAAQYPLAALGFVGSLTIAVIVTNWQPKREP